MKIHYLAPPLGMEDFLHKIRRAYHAPRETFQKELRRKITTPQNPLQRNTLENFLKISKVNPQRHFVTTLRKKLLALLPDTPLKRTHQPLAHRFSQTSKRIFVGLSSLVTSFLFLSGIFFLGGSPEITASSQTLLSSFSGSVLLNKTSLISPPSLTKDDILQTEKGASAQISFFEDSIIRMDQKTEIHISELTPHHAKNDLGHVSVEMISGRIWLRQLPMNHNFSEFIIQTPYGHILLKNGASLSIEINDLGEQISVLQGSVLVQDKKRERLVFEGKTLVRKRPDILQITPLTTTTWIQENSRADSQLHAAFLLGKMKEKESQDALDTLFFSNLSQLFRRQVVDWSIFNSTLQERFDQDPESVLASLASLEKTTASLLPDSPLFEAKIILENAHLRFSQKSEQLLKEQQKTARLYEAKKLAEKGERQMAKKIVEQQIQEDIASNQKGSSLPNDVLLEKEKQIALASEIDIDSPTTEQVESHVLSETTHIIRPHFPRLTSQKDATEQAYDIILRIKKYESEQGKRNTLHHQLNTLGNEVKSLPVLLEIQKRLPDEILRAELQQKILSILEQERRNTTHL